ncbi:hypothetical protein BJ742DRAFT_807467 [Cladochytrium replicatum]|nr:hypothetical protein BJ742DRAFT_807467 [Cladochytrium replicatum]
MFDFLHKKDDKGESIAEKVQNTIENFQKALNIKPDEKKEDANKSVITAAPVATITGAKYDIKPLDIILFNGKDPVADFIRWMEYKYVEVNKNDLPTAFWTHAGLIVDKTVLPLPELEDGKLYVYESIFSGTIAGYTYSKVLPVDHPEAVKNGNHAGPQIRDLIGIVDEANSDIGVCPLLEEERARLFSDLPALQAKMLKFHKEFFTFGYPFNVLPALGAASEKLQNFYDGFTKSLFKDDDPDARDRKTVFCSEMAAELYKALGVKGFVDVTPRDFTPVEVEVSVAFTHACYWVKYDNKNYLESNQRTINVTKIEHELPKELHVV